MEMAGASMLVGEWFAGKVLDKLADIVSSHFADHSDLQEKLKEMKDRLPAIQAVIQAAEGRPIRDPALATWLRQLKDAAFKVDDILDEFDYKQIHDQHLQDRSKVRAFATSALRFLKNLFVSDDELKRLKSLFGDLDKITQEINRKKAELDEYISKQKLPSKETISSSTEVLIGRDKEKDMILRILLSAGDRPDFGHKGAGSSSHANLCVLPIVGMGGVGKTTLAQHIYNDQRVASHFEMRSWVYVSEDFNLKKILKELQTNKTLQANETTSLYYEGFKLSDAIFMHRDYASEEAYLHLLRASTRNKKFLFVLDDVWDETGCEWIKLQSALTDGARGSTILVTTQSPLVAEVMGTIDAIRLDILEEDDYMRLFEYCSFGKKEIDPNLRKKLQLIGQNISNKLHGLPLAAKVLGILLQSRLDEIFWKAIEESEWWKHDVVLDNILPSLGLCYQHLSPNLKQCFAYTSLFPKGHKFDKERLVQMWMAQGFIESSPMGMRKEDIGSLIFDELTSKYFFLWTVKSGYVMHDLIRELAVCVSLDDCFVVNDGAVEIPPTVRHLTLRTTRFDVMGNALKIPKLRTLIFYREYPSSQEKSLEEFYKFLKDILENQTSLRVVDLSYSHTGIKKLPYAICELSHLRYLDISSTKIGELPKSFAKLYHLQVLNLGRYQFKTLPEGMNNLIKLRHLYANAETIFLIDGIGKLTELQGLEEFRASRKRGHKITELKELRSLRRRLTIENLEYIESKEEAMEAKLEHKEHLNELLLKSQGDTKKDILDGLQPHYNLKELTIEHYRGTESPSWLENNVHFINLKVVYLNNCPRLENLPPFGQLPDLKNLHIRLMDSVRRIGVEFYGNAGPVFPSLEFLGLVDMRNLDTWSDPVGEPICPHLREIALSELPNLGTTPVLPSIPMEVFTISDCGDIGNSLSDSLLHWTSLVRLEIRNYQGRTSVRLSNLTMLQRLFLNNCPRLTLIGGFQSLVNMKSLHVIRCYEVIERPRPQPEQAHVEEDLRSLTDATIDDCILNDVWFTLGRTPSLSYLKIFDFYHLVYFEAEQELWIQQLGSLQVLEFIGCRSLQRLPASLPLVSSIKKMFIDRCYSIHSLPENGLPELLQELWIWDCPILIDRCKKDEGPDWPMISNIPYIRLGGNIIQNL